MKVSKLLSVPLAATCLAALANSAVSFEGKDDAKEIFSAVKYPSAQPTRSISSSPSCGCIAGAQGLPANGDHYQIMRLQRNRRWGHPNLLIYIQSLANRAYTNGWNGLLVGDMSQPRGGPMKNGHASHQAGIDVDIWLDEMPDRILTDDERNTKLEASSVLIPGTNKLNPKEWNQKRAQFIRDAASDTAVARIFVAPAIKRALCNCKDPNGKDTEWLRRLRPWWGHDDHIHIRLHSPKGEASTEQEEPPEGDGCGQEIDDWLLKTAKQTPDDDKHPIIRVDSLPAECLEVLRAPDKK